MGVPALLIVNPLATSLTAAARERVVAALGAEVELTVAHTQYRGHAGELARKAVTDGLDAVVTLGGDGTLNEAINGLLSDHDPYDPRDPGDVRGRGDLGDLGDTAGLPAIAPLPAGSANVFARSLGLPRDLDRATDLVRSALRGGRRRPLTLGHADGRYFTFCAGFGLDAEVVRAVDEQRTAGLRATPARYVTTAVRRFFATDRRDPALTVEVPGGPPIERVLLGIVANTAPWTYAGPLPVNPTPRARLTGGLDVLTVRRMDLLSSLALLAAMVTPGGIRAWHPGTTGLHDMSAFTIRASRPVAFQMDGEYLGERTSVSFTAISDAVRLAV